MSTPPPFENEHPNCRCAFLHASLCLPIGFQAYFADLEEVRLQVQMLGGNWEALCAAAARYPFTIGAAWDLVRPYLALGEAPPPGTQQERIVAAYILELLP